MKLLGEEGEPDEYPGASGVASYGCPHRERRSAARSCLTRLTSPQRRPSSGRSTAPRLIGTQAGGKAWTISASTRARNSSRRSAQAPRHVVEDEQGPVPRGDLLPARSRPSPGSVQSPGTAFQSTQVKRPATSDSTAAALSRPGSRSPPAPDGRNRRSGWASAPSSRLGGLDLAHLRPALAQRTRVRERVVADPVALGVRRARPARGARAAPRRRRRTSRRPRAASTSRTRGVAAGSGPLSK